MLHTQCSLAPPLSVYMMHTRDMGLIYTTMHINRNMHKDATHRTETLEHANGMRGKTVSEPTSVSAVLLIQRIKTTVCCSAI